jgi:hypothetical protein
MTRQISCLPSEDGFVIGSIEVPTPFTSSESPYLPRVGWLSSISTTEAQQRWGILLGKITLSNATEEVMWRTQSMPLLSTPHSVLPLFSPPLDFPSSHVLPKEHSQRAEETAQ